MRFLKQRTPLHVVDSEPRRTRQSLFRWLYLAGVLALALWLIDFSFPGLLRFQSSGLVVGEPAVVAPEYTATVLELPLRQGDMVKRGQLATVVSSQSVLESIARLTAEIATLQARQGERQTRSVVVNHLLALAENRQRVATSARQKLESAQTRGYLPVNPHTAAIDLEYRSYQDLETLRAEKEVIAGELAKLGTALSEAEAALQELRRLFAAGHLRVPIDGVVSRVIAQQGAVVRAGDPIVELYGTGRFILAYVPTSGLNQVSAGEEVTINVGFQRMRGVVTRVEPVAAALPREFQRAFSPVETQQVIRVDFAPNQEPPPLFTKVSLTTSPFLWRLAETFWSARISPMLRALRQQVVGLAIAPGNRR